MSDPQSRMPRLASTGTVYDTVVRTQTGTAIVDTAKTPDPIIISDTQIDAEGNVTLVVRGGASSSTDRSQTASMGLPTGYTLECSVNGGAGFDCTDGRIPASRFDLTQSNTLSVTVVNATLI